MLIQLNSPHNSREWVCIYLFVWVLPSNNLLMVCSEKDSNQTENKKQDQTVETPTADNMPEITTPAAPESGSASPKKSHEEDMDLSLDFDLQAGGSLSRQHVIANPAISNEEVGFFMMQYLQFIVIGGKSELSIL